MTLKQIIDEALDPKVIQAQINSLKQTSDNISKAIKMNPALQKQFGTDTFNLSQQTAGVEQSFQQVLRDQLAKQKEEQIKQAQKTIQNSQTQQTTANPVQNSQTANGNIAKPATANF